MATAPAAAVDAPHRYLADQVRWRPLEIAFWAATLLPFLLFPSYLQLSSQVAITALFALSLDLILGYAGIVSLGHAAFFGLGAYAAGILSKHAWGEPLSLLVVAAAVAGLAGYAMSFVIARFRHLALIMITLGLGLLLHEAANSASWLTGGADGLQGVIMGPVLGQFEFDLYGRTAAWYSLTVLLVFFLLARRIVQSPFGATLKAIRDNRLRAMAIGIPVTAKLAQVYTLAAALAGAAGALLTQTTGFASLDLFEFHRSADVMLILVIGGVGWLYGGILGAIGFKLLQDVISSITPQYWTFWVGLFLVVLVLVGRDRLFRPWTWFRK